MYHTLCLCCSLLQCAAAHNNHNVSHYTYSYAAADVADWASSAAKWQNEGNVESI